MPETPSAEEYAELEKQHERSQRMLVERIAYHEARIAERQRATGESAPGAA